MTSYRLALLFLSGRRINSFVKWRRLLFVVKENRLFVVVVVVIVVVLLLFVML